MRRTRLAVVVALLAIVLVPATVSAAVPRGRFGVGDSIMLSSSDELADYGFGLNAEVGRQFGAGVPVVRRVVTKGTLPRHVVVHLGTNGPVALDDCERLIELAGPRQVYLVGVRVPRDWETDVNTTLRRCARPYVRVRFLNWWKRSEAHVDTWLATDGYHLTPDGQAAYSSWIDDRVDAVVHSLRAAG